MKNLALRFKTGASWWLATCGLLLCAARNHTGATAIEYSVIAASISIAIIATISNLDT
jgi:Flp/Fap pilin component